MTSGLHHLDYEDKILTTYLTPHTVSHTLLRKNSVSELDNKNILQLKRRLRLYPRYTRRGITQDLLTCARIPLIGITIPADSRLQTLLSSYPPRFTQSSPFSLFSAVCITKLSHPSHLISFPPPLPTLIFNLIPYQAPLPRLPFLDLQSVIYSSDLESMFPCSICTIESIQYLTSDIPADRPFVQDPTYVLYLGVICLGKGFNEKR